MKLDIVFTSREKVYYIALVHHAPDNTYGDTGRPQLLANCSGRELIGVFLKINALVLTWSDHSIQWFMSDNNHTKRKWILLYQFTLKDYCIIDNGQNILSVHISLRSMKLAFLASSSGDTTLLSSTTSPSYKANTLNLHPLPRSFSLYSVAMYENKSDLTLCLSPPICLTELGGHVVDTYVTQHILFILFRQAQADAQDCRNCGDVCLYAYNLDTGKKAVIPIPQHQSQSPTLTTTQPSTPLPNQLPSQPQFIPIIQTASVSQDSCYIRMGTERTIFRARWPFTPTSASLILHPFPLPPLLAPSTRMSIVTYAEAYTFIACIWDDHVHILKYTPTPTLILT
ncbi:hypothetical protein EON65_25190, partial [archaeon]